MPVRLWNVTDLRPGVWPLMEEIAFAGLEADHQIHQRVQPLLTVRSHRVLCLSAWWSTARIG
jgi:hypothetical protein